jgi:uncharacterized protein
MKGDYNRLNELLKDDKCEINQQLCKEGNPLIWAVLFENKEIVELLINHGFDVNEHRSCCEAILMIAVTTGNLDIVKILVDNGANINQQDAIGGASALQYACDEGHVDIVEYLIKMRADINGNDGGPLLAASRGGYIIIIQFLINNGAQVNLLDVRGSSALIWATRYNHTKSVKLLLESGTDYSIKNDSDETALSIAKENGFDEIEKIIIKVGATKK